MFKEVMAKIFPKETDIQEQKHRVSNKMNPNRPTPRYIIIKMAKVKENFKGERKKQSISYKESPIRLSADFSAYTLKVRRELHDICKVLKGKQIAT